MTLPDFAPVFKHIMTVDGTARVAVYNAMHDMLLAYAEQAVAAERERCINIVAMFGGSVEIEAAIRRAE